MPYEFVYKVVRTEQEEWVKSDTPTLPSPTQTYGM